MAPVIDPGGDTFAAGDPPHGLCVAFDDDALEVDPVWTRLDDPAATWRLRVAQVSIDRGSESETDTVKTGTCVATLNDPFGTLDPTNPGGPFYGKLDPNLQAAYARWNPVTGEWSTRFRGFIKAFRHTMDTSGFAQVTLELVDAFELFADLRMTPGDQGDTPRTESIGDIFYAGGSPIPANNTFVHVDDRQHQALDDIGWPVLLRDIFSGNDSVQEEVYERDGQIIEVLTDAADAEFPDVSRAFMSREGRYTFRGRFARFFPERAGYGIGNWELGGAAQAAADATVVRLTQFSFRRSKEDIVNVATALPKGLDDTDVPGNKVEDAASIAKYGRRPWMADNLLTWVGHDELGNPTTAAEETLKFAQFKVDNFATPKTRLESLTVSWLHPESFSGPAAWLFLNGCELGDLVHVETTHPGGGGFNEDYYIEAIREVDTPGPDVSTHVVTMQLDVSPRSFYTENPFGSGAQVEAGAGVAGTVGAGVSS